MGWQLGIWQRATFENIKGLLKSRVYTLQSDCYSGRSISVEAPIAMAESNKTLCLSESRLAYD